MIGHWAQLPGSICREEVALVSPDSRLCYKISHRKLLNTLSMSHVEVNVYLCMSDCFNQTVNFYFVLPQVLRPPVPGNVSATCPGVGCLPP